MTTLFKKLFIKNYKDVDNPEVRTAYGTASGILGIIANSLLFIIKLIASLLSGSIAIIADAINNLTDFLTSIITMIGFKVAGKSADNEHPFGHARFEYVTTLLIACVIFFIGIETGMASIDKIINNTPTKFSVTTCIILSASILIKVILAVICNTLSKDVSSDTIKAMSTDSRNDAISTTAILVCVIIGLAFNVHLDGYFGIAISLLVIYSALNLVKETVGPLIGEKADKELIDKLQAHIKSYDGILGIHELIVHCYGPKQFFASVHIEVDSSVDVMISHELADTIERDCIKNLNVNLVCHLDPINVKDPEIAMLTNIINTLLNDEYPFASIHDLRIVKAVNYTNVIFDLVLPFDKKELRNEISCRINQRLAKEQTKYFAVIEFENSFE